MKTEDYIIVNEHEFVDLFDLKNNRQIKAAIKNRIERRFEYVGLDKIKITDPELQETLLKFRQSTVLNFKQVCRKFNIDKNRLDAFIRKGLAPYYKLNSNNGSAKLFIESDLTQCVTIETRKAIGINSHGISLYSIFKDYFTNYDNSRPSGYKRSRNYEIAKQYVTSDKSVEHLASEYELSVNSCIFIINKEILRLSRKMTQSLQLVKSLIITVNQLRSQINELENERVLIGREDVYINKISSIIHEYEKSKNPVETMAIKIANIEMSLRLKNVLKQMEMNTLGDIQKFINDNSQGVYSFRKARGMGQGTYNELEKLLTKYKIS